MNFREMALDRDRVGNINKFVHALKEQGLFRNCLNCNYWQKNSQTNEQRCGLFLAMPPPEVIIVGCDSHSDFIPF